jgi:hypothetical protein
MGHGGANHNKEVLRRKYPKAKILQDFHHVRHHCCIPTPARPLLVRLDPHTYNLRPLALALGVLVDHAVAHLTGASTQQQ